MITGIAGVGWSLSPGDVTDRFSDVEAIRLIENKFAFPVNEDRIERAVKSAPRERRRKSK